MPPPEITVLAADSALLRRALLSFGATSAEPGAFAAAPGALAFVATAPDNVTAPELAAAPRPAGAPEAAARSGTGATAAAGAAGGPQRQDGSAGRVLGWCWGHLMPRPDGATMAYLHHLEVAAAHRRRGIGRLLTSTFLGAATRAGATSTFLVTGQENTKARHLYESLGATIAAQGPTVSYWWRLPR